MKVSEAIALLQRSNPDDELVIDYDIGHPTIGRSPGMIVKGIYAGFDWDKVQTTVYTETRLCAPTDESSALMAKYNRAADTLGGLYYTLSHRAGTPEFKVKECLALLKEKTK